MKEGLNSQQPQIPEDTNLIRTDKSPEKFPSKEEVGSIFGRILQGKEYTDQLVKNDEFGLYKYYITVALGDGSTKEFYYKRADDYGPKNQFSTDAKYSASIHSMDYDANGQPISYEDTTVANYNKGEWIFIGP